MSKRGRFLLILGIIACCIFFLWPTINWYGLTPKEDQVLALGSLETIKDFAGYKASEDVKTLKALAKENPGAAIPLEHAYLIKEAKKNYKLLKKNFPKEPSIRDLLAGFQNELELMNAIETMYREQILKNKRYYNNSVKLGLDLSGGMSVIVKADLEAAAKDLGKMTSDELATFNDNAMTQAVETLRGRIDECNRNNVSRTNLKK
jgi:preprotein translocase subunit SecD